MGGFRAVAFDFNGTVSHDEPILYAVYRDLFAEHGRPLSEADYYGSLAGLAEEAIIGTWLEVEGHELRELVAERIDRYLQAAAGGETVTEPVRDAIAVAAERLPVAIVSGAYRREIEPVLAGAGLDRYVTVVVSADDVDNGKPHPEGYLQALERLGDGLEPTQLLAFEDTEAGVAAAKAAGAYCVGVLGTHPAERLSAADELVEGIDARLVTRLLA